MTYDGKTVSLHPSVGNWSFPCRSHYWIDRNEIRWSHAFDDAEIRRVRKTNKIRRRRYYAEGVEQEGHEEQGSLARPGVVACGLRTLRRWLRL